MNADNTDTASPKPPSNRWKRRCLWILAVWAFVTVLTSFSTVRGWIAYPLFRHDANASGDAAYVMADGYAYWERLRAASDLYHLKKVRRVLILNEQTLTLHSFARDRSETVVERAIEYLKWHGVPRDQIEVVTVDSNSLFGSLREAESVAKQESDLRSVVIVTSAPHTRRSELAFRRIFDEEVQITVYAASPPSESWEIDAPIWMEYVKLAIYWVAA